MIVYTIGVEGHFLTARALRDELSIPLIGIILTDSVANMMDSSRRDIFSKIYNFPDYFNTQKLSLQKLSSGEINARIAELEKKYAITDATRYVYFDRALRSIRDFTKVRLYQLSMMVFLDQIMHENTISAAIGGIAFYGPNILRDISRQCNIPFIHTVNGRILNRLSFIDLNDRIAGMQQNFNLLRQGLNIGFNKKILIEAEQWYSNFLSVPTRPSYSEINSRLKFNMYYSVQKFMRAVSYQEWKKYFQCPFDVEFGYREHPLSYIWVGFRDWLRAFWHDSVGILERAPDLSCRFFYLPLHYSPEISDMIYGEDYDHHEGFVVQLAKRIPSGVTLYVKEHTSMHGRRPAAFYHKLAALHNVKMLHPAVNTFDLIKNAELNVVVTGTAGLEAYLLNKPVAVLGNVFFDFLPGVLKVSLYDRFQDKISDYLKEFKPDSFERECAIKSYFVSTYDSSKGDIGEDVDLCCAEQNAKGFALAHRYYLASLKSNAPKT
jgi:hypothetical protein